MGLVYKFLIFFYFMFSGVFLAVNSIPKPPMPPPQNKPAAQPLPQPAKPETKVAETQEIKKEEKIELPKTEEKPLFSVEQPMVPSLPEAKNESGFSVRYPLIPPYAFAVIKWDDANKEMVYEIEEPQLTDEEKKTLGLLEEGIKELINISFISVKDKDTVLIYLEKNIRVLLTELSIELTKESFLKIMYYIYRDFVGLNELEPLMNDYFIEDVECNGVNTPVYIVHRKYRNVKTSLIYTDVKTMMSFVEKLAQKAGKYISYAEPLLDAALPDGTRVQAVFSKDVATRGPSYTLRKFTKTPWSPIALVGKGTVTPEIYAYLWMAVEYENSLMIIGGTGTGKCVSGDTPIYLANGEKIPIKEIVEKKFTENRIIKKDSWELVNGDGTEILCMDIINFKITKSKIEKFCRHKAPPIILKVKCSNGSELKCTPEHPFFIDENRRIIKKRADNLLIGERIALPANPIIGSEILFIEVEDIEHILNPEEDYVYDLVVSMNHNFLAGKIPLIVHNTSFVNTVAFFIPPQARVVSIEDTKELQLEHENWLPSVARSGVGLTNLVGQKYGEVSLFDLLKASFRQRPDYIIVGEVRGSIKGDEEIFIVEDGATKRIPIKELEGRDISNTLVPTLDKDLKIKLHKIKHFIKHPQRNNLVEVVTKTGRKVVVTHDHSLFTADGCEVKPIETSKLKIGNRIIIPASIPCGYNDIKRINLIEYFPNFRIYKMQDRVKAAISKLGQKKANEICGCVARQYCRRKQYTSIPINLFIKLMEAANIKYNLGDYQIKSGRSTLVPKDIPVDEYFCRFLGYYVSEGHIQNSNRDVVITNSNKIIIDDVIKISKKLFGIVPKLKRVYGFGKSWHIIIHSTIIAKLVRSLCGKTEKKRIPPLIYGLSKMKIAAFLSGLYSGDGNNYKNEISFSSKLPKLSEDVMYLLLSFGIVSRIKKEKNKNLYRVSFKRIDDVRKFLKDVKFIQKDYKVLQKGAVHSNVNIVNLKKEDFNKFKLTRKYRHLKRYMKCSKYYLQKIIDDLQPDNNIKRFAHGEFYLDEIKQLNEISLQKSEAVYDLSINPSENFIGGFGGIILHNSEAFVLFQAFASIRGDEEIFVLKNNKPLRIKIKDLEKEDINKLNAISYNTKEKRHEILPIKAFIKHPKRKTLYKITTKSGREVTITGDHSIFTYCDDVIKETRGEELFIGSKIIIPACIPCGYNNISMINLLEYLPDLRVYSPDHVIEASHKLGYYQASNAAGVSTITDYYSVGVVSKPNAMRADKFMQLMKTAKVNYKLEDLQVKFDGLSHKWPVFFEVSDEFLKLLGYYLSEGSLNTSGRNYRMAFYNSNEEVLKDMESCIIKLTSRKPASRVTDRGWGSALELSFNNKILYEFIKRYCKTKLQKRIPDFIYGLDKRKIGIFLGALYTGDGYLRDKGIGYSTTSKELANDVAQLLQVFGIVATIRKRNREGRKTTDYEIDFYANYKKNEFLKYVKPIGKNCNIKNGIEDKKLLGDLYIDKIKSIEIINLDKPEHVYDISVPGNQNFIGGFGGILLHNSGHPGMATMHAEGVETMVKRLQTNPINLSGSLIETLAAVVVMTQSKIKGKEVRKVSSVDEIIKVSERGESGSAQINTVFKWDPKTDKFFLNPNSKVFENISVHYGFTKEQVLKEFKLRTNLLKALFKRKISDFKDVQKIIHEYYKAPEDVLKRYGVI